MAGWLDEEELRNFLVDTTVLLFPTLWEGMSMSLMQAQAQGVPAVVSNAVGNRDAVLQGRTGYVAATDHELVTRTRELLQDPALRARMSAAAVPGPQVGLSDDGLGTDSLALYREALASAYRGDHGGPHGRAPVGPPRIVDASSCRPSRAAEPSGSPSRSPRVSPPAATTSSSCSDSGAARCPTTSPRRTRGRPRAATGDEQHACPAPAPARHRSGRARQCALPRQPGRLSRPPAAPGSRCWWSSTTPCR